MICAVPAGAPQVLVCGVPCPWLRVSMCVVLASFAGHALELGQAWQLGCAVCLLVLLLHCWRLVDASLGLRRGWSSGFCPVGWDYFGGSGGGFLCVWGCADNVGGGGFGVGAGGGPGAGCIWAIGPRVGAGPGSGAMACAGWPCGARSASGGGLANGQGFCTVQVQGLAGSALEAGLSALVDGALCSV